MIFDNASSTVGAKDKHPEQTVLIWSNLYVTSNMMANDLPTFFVA